MAQNTSTEAIHLHDRAGLAYQQGDIQGALSGFTAALDIEPDYVLALINRGICHSVLGLPAKARADFDRAIELRSDFAGGYHNRALLRRIESDWVGALADLQRAVELEPEDFVVHFDLGVTHFHMHEYELALRHLNQTLQLAPYYVRAYGARAEVREGLHDYAGALDDLRRFLMLDTDGAASHKVLRERLDRLRRYAFANMTTASVRPRSQSDLSPGLGSAPSSGREPALGGGRRPGAGPPPPSVERALPLLRNEMLPRRQKGIAMLGQCDDPAAIDLLDMQLGDRDPQIRRAAASGLHEQTRRASDFEIRQRLAGMLYLMLNQEDEEVRRQALLGLAYVGHFGDIRRLPVFVEHANPQLRSAAIEALAGALPHLEEEVATWETLYCAPVIADRLKLDGHGPVRLAAARALVTLCPLIDWGELREEEAYRQVLARLIHGLRDRYSRGWGAQAERVKDHCIEALRRLNDPRAREALQAAGLSLDPPADQLSR